MTTEKEICSCKVFSGYTVGYICRACHKPIYTQEVLKQIKHQQREESMNYPIIKIDGVPVEYDKGRFLVEKEKIFDAINFDNQENDLGLTPQTISMLAWNAAVGLIHLHVSQIRDKEVSGIVEE